MKATLITMATAVAVVLVGVAGILIAQRIIVAGCHLGCWITSTIRSGVLVDTDDRQVHLYIGCGGRLRSKESAEEVKLTLSEYKYPGGVMQSGCAYSEVTAILEQPLGHRIVRDGVSGESLVALATARSTDPRLEGRPSAVEGAERPGADLATDRTDPDLYDDLPDEVRAVLSACEAWQSRTDGWFDVHRAGQLDPSGYVKGWAIDEASRMLVEAGSHWHSVNGGGDILAVAPESESPWRFGIIDPFDRSLLRGTVTGHRVALATSGVAERGRHIWDPFAQQPPDTRLLSVSVSGQDIIKCDALATAGFARGNAGPDWLRGFPGVEVLACYRDGFVSARAG